MEKIKKKKGIIMEKVKAVQEWTIQEINITNEESMLCKNMDKIGINLSREENKLKENMKEIDIWNLLKNKINFSWLINIKECWNLVKSLLKNVTFVQWKNHW